VCVPGSGRDELAVLPSEPVKDTSQNLASTNNTHVCGLTRLCFVIDRLNFLCLFPKKYDIRFITALHDWGGDGRQEYLASSVNTGIWSLLCRRGEVARDDSGEARSDPAALLETDTSSCHVQQVSGWACDSFEEEGGRAPWSLQLWVYE
jgi:hypothetical protein